MDPDFRQDDEVGDWQVTTNFCRSRRAVHIPIADVAHRDIFKPMKVRQKKLRLTEATAHYLRQIGRKAQKGEEPNDRGFDRKLDEKLKRKLPEDVDALFRGEDD